MTCEPSISFLLFSGGVGSRSGHHEPKQFFELAGHPMIAYSLMAANSVDQIGEVIINAPEGFESRTRAIAEKYCPSKSIKIIPAGVTRHESSLLLAQSAQYNSVVLHEAARPFVTSEMLLELIGCDDANAGFCQPIAFSMCEIDISSGQMVKGVPRDAVFNIQLPQIFDRSVLLLAHIHSKEIGTMFTEDAIMVVEMTGEPVRALSGSTTNLKVTTPEDFLVSDTLLEKVNLL